MTTAKNQQGKPLSSTPKSHEHCFTSEQLRQWSYRLGLVKGLTSQETLSAHMFQGNLVHYPQISTNCCSAIIPGAQWVLLGVYTYGTGLETFLTTSVL